MGERDKMAVAIGRRIKEAAKAAGYKSLKALARKDSRIDYNQLAIWSRGDAMPRLDKVVLIAEACGVSLDWLVRGAHHDPTAFTQWAEGPGRDEPVEAHAFLRSLPVRGYEVTPAFYALALQAFKLGLSPEDASLAARDSART